MRVETFSGLRDGERFDFVIVGSGFGGSVAALRLAEKGWKVAVLEAGRHFRDEDFPETNWDVRRYLWAPRLGCRGPQRLTLLDHALVLSGAGVGGGSLVYANTLLEPGPRFYEHPAVRRACPDLRERLRPHFAAARRMLGVARAPRLFAADEDLERLARASGREATLHRADVGVYFGAEGRTDPDPYFAGAGPDRAGCSFCGGCMLGCRRNAKNTLAKNYLPLAARSGARLYSVCRVAAVRGGSGGFAVEVSRSGWSREAKTVSCRGLVLAAGVLGTARLLLDPRTSLPGLSPRAGRDVRTNAEALAAASARSAGPDRSLGLAIASGYWEADGAHVEAVRFPAGADAMSLLAVRAERARSWTGLFRRAARLLLRPRETLALLPGSWSRRTTLLLFMGREEARLRLSLRRGRLRSAPEEGSPLPAAPACARPAAERLARLIGGVAQESAAELLGAATTAHVLGGAAISAGPEEGVVGFDGRAHGVDGLWIVDGSIVPANLGVNPSLTIAALAEHAMSLIPPRGA